VALGSIGPFCVIKQNGPIEPHTTLLSSFAPFFFCCGHCSQVKDRVFNGLSGLLFKYENIELAAFGYLP
jgi:hypothetical protein